MDLSTMGFSYVIIIQEGLTPNENSRSKKEDQSL